MFGNQQPRRNTGDLFKQIFLGKNTLSRLILINIGVFLGVNLINAILRLAKVYTPDQIPPLVEWLALPVDPAMIPTHFWTIITYMFVQTDFRHLLFNMIVLYFGSIIFIQFFSQRKLLYTYLAGGIAGAFLFVVIFNISPLLNEDHFNSILLGSSASVFAILIAVSWYKPDFTVHLIFIGPTKLKYITLVVVFLDLLQLFDINTRNPDEINFGGHLAHLGGALWGFIFAYYYKKGNDLYRILDGIKLPEFKTTRKKPDFETYRKPENRPLSDEDFNKKKKTSQEEIDMILDKISRSGYESLTKNEKEQLFKSSNKN